jgi:hypothetical protein
MYSTDLQKENHLICKSKSIRLFTDKLVYKYKIGEINFRDGIKGVEIINKTMIINEFELKVIDRI